MILLTLFAHVVVFWKAHIFKKSCQDYFHTNCVEGDSLQGYHNEYLIIVM
jgi:hypothetical protein